MEFNGSNEEILNYYYKTETIRFLARDSFEKDIDLTLLEGQRATREIKNPKTGEVIVKKNRKFNRGAIKKIETAKMKTLPVDAEELWTKVSAFDIVDDQTGEVLLECNEEISQEKVDALLDHGVSEVKVLFIDNLNVGSFLRDTLILDKIPTPEEAIMEIYRRLRPGDPPTEELWRFLRQASNR